MVFLIIHCFKPECKTYSQGMVCYVCYRFKTFIVSRMSFDVRQQVAGRQIPNVRSLPGFGSTAILELCFLRYIKRNNLWSICLRSWFWFIRVQQGFDPQPHNEHYGPPCAHRASVDETWTVVMKKHIYIWIYSCLLFRVQTWYPYSCLLSKGILKNKQTEND